MDKNNADMKKQEQEQIVELGSDITNSSKGKIYTLTIIGQVEGHQVAPETVKTTKYEHVLPLLAGIEESDEIDGLLLLLNTVGGDIEAGLAISEMIAGMKKPTVSLVLGGGHSIDETDAQTAVIADWLNQELTPENFEKAMRAAKEYIDRYPERPALITVNSWNEWTETSYLEPDDFYGYGYLEAIKKIFVDGE